jgi:hypothetical protein
MGAFAAGHGAEMTDADAVVQRPAGDANRAVILLRAVQPVREDYLIRGIVSKQTESVCRKELLKRAPATTFIGTPTERSA